MYTINIRLCNFLGSCGIGSIAFMKDSGIVPNLVIGWWWCGKASQTESFVAHRISDRTIL
jgi:hypothetical protein